ncbi:hypothetical protein [Gorillibacterium sp. sgz5001074]|uniref:hypothetical protein n=1 Tax=Gorillibacterium sp. sgz5001074 TaxID=3446695 RepID=UPI003F66818E
MPVQIQINGENAAEAIKELAVLAAGLNGSVATPESKATPATPKQERQSRKNQEQAKLEPEPAEERQLTNAEMNEQLDRDLPGEDTEEEEGPIPTVVELRAAAQGRDREKVKALLQKFESKSISEVPENKRAAFMKELESL